MTPVVSSSQIDPRGPRFGAWITTAVLAAVLLLSAPAATLLVTAQAVVFALGSRGRSPYQLVFKRFVRPKLAPPSELEDAGPTRFAQLVGLAFASAAAGSFVAGATTVGQVFTAFALVAALLNVAAGLCLGCELYLLVQRATSRDTHTEGATV